MILRLTAVSLIEEGRQRFVGSFELRGEYAGDRVRIGIDPETQPRHWSHGSLAYRQSVGPETCAVIDLRFRTNPAETSPLPDAEPGAAMRGTDHKPRPDEDV